MLLWLTEYLSEFVGAFSVFQYLTFRTMVSALTALLMSLIIGPVMIRKILIVFLIELFHLRLPPRP